MRQMELFGSDDKEKKMASEVQVDGSGVDQKYCPAYVPFGTFKNFIDTLKANGIPTKVNKSVMTNLSGATQSHLVSAIKSLGLIESDGEPTSALVELVDSFGTDDWVGTLKKVLDGAYGSIVDGLDLTKASPEELEKRFSQNGGVEGSMNDKAVRFYLAACKEAKIEVSEYLKKRRGRPSKSRQRASKNSAAAGPPKSRVASNDVRQQVTPPGCIEYPVHLKNGRRAVLIVPVDVTEAECKIIELALPLVKAYAEQQAEPRRIEHTPTEPVDEDTE